jgi:hypothetical protein
MSSYRSDSRNPTAVSAFGEPIALPVTPLVQQDGIYSITLREFETFTSSTGNVSATNAVMTAWTGTSTGGYGVIRSRKHLRYRPGQGALARFTAGFSTPDANTTQRAGFFSQEQALMIGYDGTQFGVLRQNGGKAEIYEIEITNGATVGSGNITITLNGTAYTIAVTSGDSNTAISTKIAASSTFSSVWLVEQINAHVRFACKTNGAKTGTYSFNGDATGVTATITHLQTGVADTNHWTYQSNFSLDTLDGTGNYRNPSGMLLDPSKLNVYQINYRWLGAGEIRYAIENQITGDMMFFHHENYTNQYTVPHLDNPSMKIGYVAANLTAGGSANVSVYGASMMGAIEGPVTINKFPVGVGSDAVSSLPGNTYNHVLSVKNSLVHTNKYNLRIIRLKRVSVAYDGTDPALLYLFLNPTLNTTPVWTASNLLDSSANYSTTTGSFNLSVETPLACFAVPKNSGIDFDVDNMNIEIPPNNRIAFALWCGKVLTTVTLAATWVED